MFCDFPWCSVGFEVDGFMRGLLQSKRVFEKPDRLDQTIVEDNAAICNGRPKGTFSSLSCLIDRSHNLWPRRVEPH